MQTSSSLTFLQLPIFSFNYTRLRGCNRFALHTLPWARKAIAAKLALPYETDLRRLAIQSTQVDFADQPRINSMVLRNSEKASNRLKSTLPYETTLRRLAIQSTQVDFTDQPRINSMV